MSIPMKFHSTSTYQFFQTILFDCPLLFSKYKYILGYPMAAILEIGGHIEPIWFLI